jgi:small subunit ribosomal protein S14
MAKKSAIEKNKNRAAVVRKYAARRQALKKKIYDRNLPLEERFLLNQKLSKLPRNSTRCRLRNRCRLTGRPRGVYRDFQMSRLAVRELALSGLLPGIMKSSW